MINIEEKTANAISAIEELHESVSQKKWHSLGRDAFVFELERSAKKLKEICLELEELNKAMHLLLEKNTPEISDSITELRQGLDVLEKNLVLEKTKRLREETIHSSDQLEVPDLYSSLQQKTLNLSLKARYAADKIKIFLEARKVSVTKKGSTAKALIDILQKKEDELIHMRQNMLDLKRKSFFGTKEETSSSDIEKELYETDKKMDKAVSEAVSSLKTHLAQISYVEGSYSQLKQKIELIEGIYKTQEQKTFELLKALKKERDYAKTMALEVEHDTIKTKSEYNKELLSFEEKKSEIEQKAGEKFEKEILTLKKIIEEKNQTIKHMNKLLFEQESKINSIKLNVEKNNAAEIPAQKEASQENKNKDTKSITLKKDYLPLDREELPFENLEKIDSPQKEDFTGPYVKDPKWLKSH